MNTVVASSLCGDLLNEVGRLSEQSSAEELGMVVAS